ncbi:MAG: PIN domain-containing protein [Coriobacteriia bacterium]|nr:PIN domain-containing protein [Coriobacteriia bacterium]
MKVLFDACVVIDIMMRSAWAVDAFASYDICQIRQYDVLVPVESTTDIAYVLHRRGFSKAETCEALAVIMDMFTLCDTIHADAQAANESAMDDYEDALIAFSAARNGVDLVVTRNVKDFAKSPVKAITPKQFVETFCPPDISYSEIAF